MPVTSSSPANPPRTLAPTLIPGLLAFFVMGALQASYGPLFPALQQRYDVSGATVAWIASTHFLGSTLAPILAGLALARFSTRRVVNAGLSILLLGVVGIAFAPAWPVVLGAALTAGLGLGLVSAALNTAYAQIGTRPSNIVNALFGVGSLLAPLMVAGTAALGLRVPFLVVASLAGLTLLAVWRFNVPEVQRHTETDAASPTRPLAWPLLVVFPLLLVAYVATEVGFGAWIGRHLSSLGWHNPALIVSGYWGGLTLGRMLTGAFGPRFQPNLVVLGAALLATTCALCATMFPAAAPIAYVLAGVALGPVFATTLVWVSRVLSPRTVPLLLIAANIGGVLSPAVIGWNASRGGPGVIPQTILLIAVFLTAMVVLASRLTRKEPPVVSGG